MQWYDEELEVIPKTERQIFQETFLGYFELFKLRVNRLAELPKESLDYKTYFDMALIQLRALCIENPKLRNNYTLQNYLRVHGLEEKVSEVNEFLNVNIGGSITLKEAIRVTTDKLIAHYDTITKYNSNNSEYQYDCERTFYSDLTLKK